MARTLTQIRQLTVRQTGLTFISGTADTGGTTTILRDSILKVYPNDRLNGFHILLTSGSPSLTELLITDFAITNGDATFIPALAAAPDALTYEILPFSGTQILRAIQDAVSELYDRGLLIRECWLRMMAGSPLYNADWSYWTSATVVDGWTVASATLARERASGNVQFENAVKLSTATGTLTLDARWRTFLEDMKGATITLYCPVKCDTASAARINLYDGANNYSSYHGGTSTQWELLHVQVTVSETATNLYPQLVLDSASAVAYFGMPFIGGAGSRVSQYPFTAGSRVTQYPFTIALMPDGPAAIRLGWAGIEKDKIASGRGLFNVRDLGRQKELADFGFFKHHDENTTTEVGILDLSTSKRIPADGQHMWVIGDGPLTVPATATGTENLEITESESLLLATLAARKLLEAAMPEAPLSLQRLYGDRVARLTRNFELLAGGAGRTRGVAALPLRW